MAEKLDRRIDLQIEWDVYQKWYNIELAKVRKNAKMDGFRKGKMPIDVVKSNYHPSISQKAADFAINQAWQEYLKKNLTMKLATQPQYEPEFNEEKKILKCTINFDVLPTLPDIPLSELQVSHYHSEITEEDIESMSTKILKERTGQSEKSKIDILKEMGFTTDPEKNFKEYLK